MLARLALLTLVLSFFVGMSNAVPLWHDVARTAGYSAAAVLVALVLLRRRAAH